MRLSAVVAVLLAMSFVAAAEELSVSLPSISSRLAEQIVGSGIRRVGVLEFANNGPGGSILGGDTGCAGRYLAEKVEEGLVKQSGGRYQVVERQRLDSVVKEIKLQLSDLVDPATVGELGKLSGVDALVLGTLTRMGEKLDVAVKVVEVSSGQNQAMDSVNVDVSSDLLALFGTTIFAPTLARPPTGNPFLVRVLVGGRALPARRVGEADLVEAAPGKVYEIELANRSDRGAAVALFVDGLNTIGQKRELPSEGKKWVLSPGQKITVKGWQTGAEAARQFLFTDSSESLAARRGFHEDIGVITACFYPEKTGAGLTPRGRIGTGEGAAIGSQTYEVKMEYEEEPAGIVSVRYDHAAGR